MTVERHFKIHKWQRPLFDQYRYKVLYGGRGSGKSYAVADTLIFHTCQKQCVVVCGREFQNSIKDSVHSLICQRIEANGLGESVARDVILHESYLTNFMHSDLRIREITQGTDLWNVIDRTARYDRTYIQHSVPRYNNPTGVFDNDQYVLEIIQPEGTSAALAASLDAFLTANGIDCDPVETIGSTACDLTTPLA